MSDFQYNEELSATLGLVKSQSAELDRLRAEVASLIKENENLKAYAKHERSLGAEPWMLQCNDLTQQLAAANGRVERMREALELAHGHLLVWQTPQYQPKQNVFDTVTAALSDLAEADKEKSE